MRHGRAKAARKTIQFFERTQGFRLPYHVLLDGTFIVAAVQYHLPMVERLERLLQINSSSTELPQSSNNNQKNNINNNRLILTVVDSTLRELEQLRDNVPDENKKEMFAKAIVWAREHCERVLRGNELERVYMAKKKEGLVVKGETKEDKAINTQNDNGDDDENENENGEKEQDDTITDERLQKLSAAGRDLYKWVTLDRSGKSVNVGSNYPHYFVASQDEELLDILRGTGKAPIVRLARGSVLLLEQPSKLANRQASKAERQKWLTLSEPERSLVQTIRRHEKKKKKDAVSNEGGNMRRKRKAKGPNPLSCKKKKTVDPPKDEGAKRKRKRSKKSSSEAATSS